MAKGIFVFPAGSFDYPILNPAPLERDIGVNKNQYRHLLDDTTEEFVLSNFNIISNIDADAEVTFLAVGYSKTAAASKNIQLKFYHTHQNAGETWDAAYSTKLSTDKAVFAGQDFQDYLEWTETVANLGWASKDKIDFKLSRIAADANNLVGDWGLTMFVIIIPII